MGKNKNLYENRINLDHIKLNQQFEMKEDTMKKLGLEKITIKDHENDKEFWTFCKFDRDREFNKEKRYLVSTYGRVYDLYRRKLCSQVDSSKWCTCTHGHYKYINMNLCGLYKMYAVHRLVALAFFHEVPRKNIVNHIDEIPYHNYVWNLEWVDKSDNANLHNMMNEAENNLDKNVVNTRWTYQNLIDICTMIAEGHKATYIYNEMKILTNNDPKIQYERIRTLYKHIMRRGDFHDIAVECGVIFSDKPDYSKEKGSVQRIKELRKEQEKEQM